MSLKLNYICCIHSYVCNKLIFLDFFLEDCFNWPVQRRHHLVRSCPPNAFCGESASKVDTIWNKMESPSIAVVLPYGYTHRLCDESRPKVEVAYNQSRSIAIANYWTILVQTLQSISQKINGEAWTRTLDLEMTRMPWDWCSRPLNHYGLVLKF